jgi:heme-degrading monooxygenase HmoA
MATIIIKHKVRDFEIWRKQFEQQSEYRKEAGFQGTCVYKSKKDPNTVVIYTKTEEPEKVSKFLASDDLKHAMKDAGVIDQPTVMVLDECIPYDY